MRNIQEITSDLHTEMRKKLLAETEISILIGELLSTVCTPANDPAE